MIAMQYSFTLPADYDMRIIRERIASKGALLDNLPGLAFKAYLYAERDDDDGGGQSALENLYAPFYLWRDAAAMHDFLASPGFAGVSQAFGWPAVATWTPWHASVGDGIRQARHATRQIVSIAPYSDLAQLRRREEDYVQGALQRGALAVVIGFEPGGWSIVRLCLWRDAPEPAPALAPGEQRYRVGHLSAPGQD
jgi:hypothetical protein